MPKWLLQMYAIPSNECQFMGPPGLQLLHWHIYYCVFEVGVIQWYYTQLETTENIWTYSWSKIIAFRMIRFPGKYPILTFPSGNTFHVLFYVLYWQMLYYTNIFLNVIRHAYTSMKSLFSTTKKQAINITALSYVISKLCHNGRFYAFRVMPNRYYSWYIWDQTINKTTRNASGSIIQCHWVIEKYFALTHGVHWKYVHMTPRGSWMIRFLGHTHV